LACGFGECKDYKGRYRKEFRESKDGEALDIPLILLDRDFKKKYFSREWNKYYKKTDKGKGGDVYGKR